MATNAQKTVDWAEDGEPDLATAIPAPQVSKNKDGTETVVTIFINEDGKKVKRTQRIRRTVVKKKENPRVAERRAWTKIGEEAGKPAGPGDTTTLGENIMFKPSVGFKAGGAQEKAPEEDKKADALKKMQIKCRICSGDHFTTKCPFKDTMAPAGEDAAPADMAAAEGGSEAAGGLGGASGGYVPPHLRKGGAGTTGERMGGKFERDDLATLRVTNVCLSCEIATGNTLTNNPPPRSPNSPKKTTSARSSSATAVSLVSSWPRTARPAVPRALLSSLTQTAQMLLGRASAWMATVSAT
jgi:translation initiation factor 3 subunit G